MSGLLDCPHFTRPEVWRDQSAPPELLSGHHAHIAQWRRASSLRLTAENRPANISVVPAGTALVALVEKAAADLDQAEARLAQARNNLITEKTNLADAQVNYFSVVGRDAGELTRPAGLQGLLPESLSAARQEMLANNPFLSSAEADV